MTAPNLPTAQVIESGQEFWGSPLKPAGCPQCKQVFLVAERQIGLTCPNCAGAPLAAQPAVLRPEPPELLIPFQKTSNALQPVFQNFVKAVWLRPDDFNEQALLQRCIPLFAPVWLVDANLAGSWEVEVGYDYQVKSSRDAYQGGRWVSQEVVENRVRYEPRAGTLERRYDNAAVAALSGHTHLIDHIGDYNYKQAKRFERAQLGEALLQLPDLSPESAWPAARDRLDRRAVDDCVKASGAKHLRDSAVQFSYTRLNWTQMLLPLYTSYYRDDNGQTHTILVNGQTGQIGGVRMASQRKGWRMAAISAGISVLLFLLSMLFFALGSAANRLSGIAAFLVLAALGAVLFAVFPAVWPWQWNRRQTQAASKPK